MNASIVGQAVAAAAGATVLPGAALPYLGLLPLALGIRAGVRAWRVRWSRGRSAAGDTCCCRWC